MRTVAFVVAMGDSVRTAVTTQDSVEPSLDYSPFQAVNGFVGHNRVVDAIMIGFAKYSPMILALVLIVLWVAWTYTNQRGTRA